MVAAPQSVGESSVNKSWYVIHTYAGFEGRVKASILERANQMGLVEKLGQVLVPTEDVIEIKDGKRRTSKRKFFPGYVLVELESPLTDETVQMIKETPKVTGFVGGGTRPIPLTSEEAESLLKQVDSGAAAPREQIRFIKGDNVRIIDGPFLGFNGLVDEVDQDHSRVKVLVSIFGRSTPVELGFLQVERL
jgi:transcription termination/antitermination protein NusG